MDNQETRPDASLINLGCKVETRDQDGFHHIDVTVPGYVADEETSVYRVRDTIADATLDIVRARMLVEAMVRFLATDGTRGELTAIAQEMASLPRFSIAGLKYQGSHIIGSVEHLFLDPKTDEFLRVVEGRFVDRMSLEEYDKYLAEVAASDIGDLDAC